MIEPLLTETLDYDAIRQRVKIWLDSGGKEQLEKALALGEQTRLEFMRAATLTREDLNRPWGPLRSAENV